MVCTHDPEPEPLEGVRRLGIEDIDVFMPAAIDMFTEEVGVSPIAGGRGPGYRARVAQSISQGRVYGRIDHGETIFKAEIGAVGRGVRNCKACGSLHDFAAVDCRSVPCRP